MSTPASGIQYLYIQLSPCTHFILKGTHLRLYPTLYPTRPYPALLLYYEETWTKVISILNYRSRDWQVRPGFEPGPLRGGEHTGKEPFE